MNLLDGRALLAIAALVSSSCGSGPLIRHSELDCLGAEQAFLPASLAAWKEGFDAREERDSDWRVGDRVLYGVELESGGEHKSWLVHLEVERVTSRIEHTIEMPGQRGKYAAYSHDLVVRVKTLDGTGRLLSATTAEVPGEQLSTGLFLSCESVFDSLRVMTEEERQKGLPSGVVPYVHASVSTFLSLMQLLQENESLSTILGEVVQLPSILTLLFASKIRIGIAPLFQNVRKTGHALVEG
ncbi:MAG: hypothetical protein ACE5F1_16865, partial [Planctomycetota bacterium]